MARYDEKILLALIIVCIYNLFEGCSVNREIVNLNEHNEIKIGVIVYKQEDPFILSITDEIQELAKEKEYEDNCKITVNIVDAKGSLITQNNQVDKFISQDYDVICVNIVDRTAASMIINKCKRANKPIIFFNREPVEEDMELWDKVYYVGTNSEQSGILQGEIIVDEYENNRQNIDRNNDGKIQYVMLEGEPEHQDSLIRTECFIKTMDDNNIEVEKLAEDTANWQNAQAYEKMIQWIEEFGNSIEVIVSNNDGMAIGAINAMENANISIKDRPIVVGIDAIQDALMLIQSDAMVGTVFNDYKSQAKGIFDIAYYLCTDENTNLIKGLQNGKYIKTTYEKVTKENVDNYIKHAT